MRWEFPNPNTGNVEDIPLFSDGPMTACGLLWVNDTAQAASPHPAERGRKRWI
jgi:hypothetical protein